MKSQDRYFGLRTVLCGSICPVQPVQLCLLSGCHPIHYPAFEMKFEVKNNQTNETEFYVKRSKPNLFKCQHFSTPNETRLCLSLAKLSCHAISSISKIDKNLEQVALGTRMT